MGPPDNQQSTVNSTHHHDDITSRNDFSQPTSTSNSAYLNDIMAFNCKAPKLAHQFDHENAVESATILLKHFRPELRDKLQNEKLLVKEFTGGVTNKLLAAYFASDKANKTLIRVYGAETDKMIDRVAEIMTLETLHRYSCCGKLYGVFENGICYEFLAGVPLTLTDVRDDHISRLVIEELVKLHSICREASHENFEEVDLFAKMTSFYQLLPKKYDDPAKQRRFQEYYPNLEIFQQEIETLRQHLADPAVHCPKVFCHNDLLCANILYDETEDGVNFIDFEYAGLNFQAYDLANHFNEFAGVEDCDYGRYPSREYQLSWLKYYLECWNKVNNGAGDSQHIAQQQLESLYVMVNKFTLISHLFWVMWTVIQAEHSDIDFDFLRYGKIRFDEYNRRKDYLLDLTVPK